MSGITRFATRWRNTIFSAADHVWLLLLWAVSTPIFIGLLGATDFGIWILINAVIGLGGVMSFGFGEATIRYVSKYRGLGQTGEIRRIVETSLALYVLVAALTAAGMFFAAPALAQHAFQQAGPGAAQTVTALRLAAAALFITAWLKTFEAVVNGFERFDLTAKVGIVTRSFIILANLALAFAGYGLAALIGAAVVGLAGQAVALFWICRSQFTPWLRWVSLPDAATVREIWGFSLQTWLQITAGATSTVADRFVVSILIDPAAAGVYAVCLQLAQQTHLLVVRGLAFLLPAASREVARDGGSALLRSYRDGCALVLVLAGTIALPLYCLAPQILELWVGAEFARAGAQTLRIMALYFAVWGSVVPMFNLVNGAGHASWNTAATLCYGATGLALCVLMVPVSGVEGAAHARVLALPAYLPILWALHRFVLGGLGWGISLSALAWLGVMGGLALWLGSLTQAAIPAAWPAVLGAGIGLAVVGLGVALLAMGLGKALAQPA